MTSLKSPFRPVTDQPWFALHAKEQMLQYTPKTPGVANIYRFKAGENFEATYAIPDGCVDLMLDCSANDLNGKLCGSTLSPQNAELKAGHEYLGIRLKAGALFPKSDVSAKGLIDQTFDIKDVLKDKSFLFEQLASESDFKQQAQLIEQHFAKQPLHMASTKTQAAVQCIFQHQGNLQVTQIEQLTGISKRTLQRLFMEDIGLSPKSFSRIVRCQSAVTQINQQTNIRLIELAYELGFSDQPHFLREFKNLVNSTPFDYQKRLQNTPYSSLIQVI